MRFFGRGSFVSPIIEKWQNVPKRCVKDTGAIEGGAAMNNSEPQMFVKAEPLERKLKFGDISKNPSNNSFTESQENRKFSSSNNS